jgi:hypothetical protein
MKILLAFLISSPLFSFAQDNFFLSGRIEHPTGNTCYLSYYDTISFKEITLDSSLVDSEGNFKMSAKIENSIEATFYDGNEYAFLLIDKGDNLNMYVNIIKHCTIYMLPNLTILAK